MVVLAAHGSRASEANEAHVAMAAALRDALDGAADVVPAFLELAEPSIGVAIDQVAGAGTARVIVVAHFLYPGRHVTEHVPEIVAAAAARHPEIQVELAGASGSAPEMVGLLAGLARSALSG